MTEYLTVDLQKLRETPLNIRWRVQEFAKPPFGGAAGKRKPYATCVGYSNIQDVQDHLDNIVGSANWQVKHSYLGSMLITYIGVKVGGEWIWKGDTGSSGVNPNKPLGDQHKSLLSDSFKRAAVLWGVGRYNYFLPRITVPADKWKEQGSYPNVVDNHGNRVMDITKFVNTEYAGKIKAAVANYLANAVDPDDERALVDGEEGSSPEDYAARKETLEALMAEAGGVWTPDTVSKYITDKLKCELTFEELLPAQQSTVIQAVQDYITTKKNKKKE